VSRFLKNLPARQARVLQFIARSVAEQGYPPTLRQIAEHLCIGSTNGSSDHIRALVRKGMITVRPLTARGITLTAQGRAYLEDHPEPSPESPSPNTTTEG
jgi:repressor LexA